MTSESPPPPTPLIERFEPLKSSRITIHLDDDTSFDIPADLLVNENLRVGDPVDEHLRATLEDTDLRWRCRF